MMKLTLEDVWTLTTTLKLMMAFTATRLVTSMAILLMRTVQLLRMALEKGLIAWMKLTSSWLLALNQFTMGFASRRRLTTGQVVGGAAQTYLQTS